MSTYESLIREFELLAGKIVSEYTLKYRNALLQDPGLSPHIFYDSVSEQLSEKLTGTAAGMLQKSASANIQNNLDLVFSLKKINDKSRLSLMTAIELK